MRQIRGVQIGLERTFGWATRLSLQRPEITQVLPALQREKSNAFVELTNRELLLRMSIRSTECEFEFAGFIALVKRLTNIESAKPVITCDCGFFCVCAVGLCSRSCGGSCVGTGRRLLIALTQVRFLPPQLAKARS